MGAHKCDVVVVIKMGPYIHGVLILCGCLIIPILQYAVRTVLITSLEAVSWIGSHGAC